MRYFFLVLFLCYLLVGGCGEPDRAASVDVTVIGADIFPAELAGTWRANQRGWEITLAGDGQITEIVHTMGRVRLEPAKTAEIEMLMEGTSIYEPGEWSVVYDHQSRELTVQIVLDYFYAEIGTGTVEGSTTDIFTGKVEDNVWFVDWTGQPKYITHTQEHGTVELKVDPYSLNQSILFEKVQP